MEGREGLCLVLFLDEKEKKNGVNLANHMCNTHTHSHLVAFLFHLSATSFTCFCYDRRSSKDKKKGGMYHARQAGRLSTYLIVLFLFFFFSLLLRNRPRGQTLQRLLSLFLSVHLPTCLPTYVYLLGDDDRVRLNTAVNMHEGGRRTRTARMKDRISKQKSILLDSFFLLPMCK